MCMKDPTMSTGYFLTDGSGGWYVTVIAAILLVMSAFVG